MFQFTNPLPFVLVVVVIAGVWMGYFLRVRVVAGISLVILISVLCGLALLLVIHNTRPQGAGSLLEWQTRLNDEASLFVTCTLIVVNIGIAIVVKLYRATILKNVTTAESTVGAPGFRAWLSPLNVVSAVVIAAAAIELDYSFLGVLFLAMCLLLVFPLANTLLNHPSSATLPTQAPAEERQRVLALVEAGKITAEDGAELLGALAQSQVATVESASVIGGPRQGMIVGAATVLVCFLLPWFTVNVTQAMSDTMRGLQTAMPQFPGIQMNVNAAQVPVQTMQTTLHGGDVRYGLGWIAIAISTCAAGLPFFWTSRSINMLQQRNATFAALAAGSVAMLYLLSDHMNAITTIEPGFIFAMAGYGVLWFGAIREYGVHRSAAAVAAPAMS